MDAPAALGWVERLISLAIVLQTLEFLQLRKSLTDPGVWSWSVIRREFASFSAPVRAGLDFFLKYPNFIYLLGLRLLVAIVILGWPHPACLFFLLGSTLLISLRWRGTFNGGSDFMTLIVLMGLSVATAFPTHPRVQIGCLWYIAIQTATSYFLAGFVKLKKANWRRGFALQQFLRSNIYGPHPLFAWLLCPGTLAAVASGVLSWAVMAFECGFPAALFQPRLCLAFIGIAGLFHIANFFVFGLNRFVFAWAAAYPALFFCSNYLKP